MAKTKNEVISSGFYIDRHTLTYFSHELENSNISLTTEVIQDLEIISEPALERVIKSWLDQSKATPSSIMLILSQSVFFSQQLSTLPTTKDDPQLLAFLDIVPFDDVKTNVFPLQQGALVMAQNRTLIDPLISVLEKMGFRVLCIVGSFALGMSAKDEFTKEHSALALNSIAQLLTFNTLSPAEVTAKNTKQESFLAVKFDKKLVLMTITFSILLLVLGLLVWMQNR